MNNIMFLCKYMWHNFYSYSTFHMLNDITYITFLQNKQICIAV